MDQQKEHDLSHRQERELRKEEHRQPTAGMALSSTHPAWYVVVGLVAIGVAVFIWSFFFVP